MAPGSVLCFTDELPTNLIIIFAYSYMLPNIVTLNQTKYLQELKMFITCTSYETEMVYDFIVSCFVKRSSGLDLTYAKDNSCLNYRTMCKTKQWMHSFYHSLSYKTMNNQWDNGQTRLIIFIENLYRGNRFSIKTHYCNWIECTYVCVLKTLSKELDTITV